ncbi:class I SAM-dependent methyltransferase [Sphingomonas sp. MMS12-HWE2-04]|uniref:class I SAM-dependent methyltransferase n=1 Tax=Sphingomonas sp. MMS12-HWE2-04 TaxID=3234199 RepID=UPI00384D4DAE
MKIRFFPETALAGFSHLDGTVGMYTQVAAMLRPTDVVLEFGAGRGANILSDPSPYRQWLQTLKGRCARVAGCDLDPVVLQNPFLDDATVLQPGQPLPYTNDTFDLILSNNVFEHVDDAETAAAELLRVLKPGGVLCASTPNKFGYVALMAMLVKNTHHSKVLARVQPHRLPEDVFPTRYRMNTPRTLRRLFGRAAEVIVYATSAEPSYHFNNALIYRAFMILHRLLPRSLGATLIVFVRKAQTPGVPSGRQAKN